MKRIDGIHRAFIVASLTWALIAVVFLFLYVIPELQRQGKDLQGTLAIILAFLIFWIPPTGFMYSIVWVINGFRKKK
jgi:hypothetical protein